MLMVSFGPWLGIQTFSLPLILVFTSPSDMCAVHAIRRAQ